MRKARFTIPIAILSVLGCSAGAALAQAPQQDELRGELYHSLKPEQRVAAHRAIDLRGSGREELMLVAEDGEVRLYAQSEARAGLVAGHGDLRLARPEFAVMSLTDLDGDGGRELVVYDDRGVEVFTLVEGGFSETAVKLIGDARMRVRIGRPMFADITEDLNGDGLPDLVLPVFEECQLWLNSGPGEGGDGTLPGFELSQVIPVPVSHRVRSEVTNLAETYRNEVRVPRLDIEDINGDGRPDLRARSGDKRRFFLQGENGRFADKAIEVDLSMFRDTTPEADFSLGKTLVLSDDQQFQAGDLNGDGIPDYAIAHRRKVWSFLGGSAGPQFKRAQTRIVAEDISGLLLMQLDDDDRDDLMIFKIVMPTPAELVLGLVSSIDIPIKVIGYRTDENGSFEGKARWSRQLTLRLPSVIKLLGEANNLVEEFMDVLAKLRWSTVGDFDGDGQNDLALISEDETRLEIWLSPPRGADEQETSERWLRDLLFTNPDTVYDIDRLLLLASQIFDARTASMTGERQPDTGIEISVAATDHITGMFTADFDGDGRDEVVLVSEPLTERGRPRFDLIRWHE